MTIRIEAHTLERAEERGTDEDEIIEVIETGFPVEAKYKREGRAKVFNFQGERLGKYYEQKRVEVFYIIEDEEIVTVTVYVFYGKW
jgi:hypothetical protein